MKILLNIIIVFQVTILCTKLNSQVEFDSSIVSFQEIIYFGLGQHKLVDSSIIKLEKFLIRSNQKQVVHFLIDAHTDDIGTDLSNIDLSNKRKQSVYNHFLENGIKANQIISLFHGERNPVTNNKDSISRQINRRVVVQAITKERFIYVTGQILDIDSNKGIPGIVQLKSKILYSSVITNNKGFYKIAVPRNKLITLSFFAKGYFFDTNKINVIDSNSNDSVLLKKASIGTNLILKDINFVGGQNILILSSETSLQNLIKFMSINDEVCIELSGHINSFGGPHYSPKNDLSIARSLIIYEKLKRSGINLSRMLAKGYGDSAKLYHKPQNSEEMELNRRVEIIIVDCDSIKLYSNDTLVDPKYYSNIVKDRKFNIETFQDELKYFYHNNQSEILYQLRFLKNNNEDPTKYTYAGLLKDGQELKYGQNQNAIILREIYTKDQSLRIQIKEIEKNHGLQSDELKEHWKKINRSDSLNLIKVKNILDRHGWLSPEKVSEEGNAALFLVIQHSDLSTQVKYLPMMKEAVKLGNANKQDLALLEDRVALRQGRKQIFGSQIYKDKGTGENYLAPLHNPEKVNARRKEVGLDPIEDYLLLWNLDWKEELKRLINNN